jgi:exonuclease SbcD
VTEGDGVRDLYVGTAAAVPSSLFDDRIDYVALGHLHVPQKVAGKEHVRYSGSPLPMGFGEAGQKKQVVVIDFSHDSLFPLVETMDLPVFQTLLRIGGTLEQIESRLQAAVDSLKSIWVEVNYDGTLSAQELGKQLDMIVQGSQVEILRLKNTRLTEHVLGDDEWHTTLDDLDEKEVFRRRLELEEMEDDEKTILTRLYGQVLQSLREEEAL